LGTVRVGNGDRLLRLRSTLTQEYLRMLGRTASEKVSPIL
jgi:hypothetical protein